MITQKLCKQDHKIIISGYPYISKYGAPFNIYSWKKPVRFWCNKCKIKQKLLNKQTQSLKKDGMPNGMTTLRAPERINHKPIPLQTIHTTKIEKLISRKLQRSIVKMEKYIDCCFKMDISRTKMRFEALTYLK